MMEFLVFVIASYYQLPYGLLPAICHTESKFIEKAVNEQDPSYGVCQVMLPTAKLVLKRNVSKEELLHGVFNISVAALYVRRNIKRYPYNLKCVISAYNAGSCTFKNKRYVEKVLKKLKQYNPMLYEVIK